MLRCIHSVQGSSNWPAHSTIELGTPVYVACSDVLEQITMICSYHRHVVRCWVSCTFMPCNRRCLEVQQIVCMRYEVSMHIRMFTHMASALMCIHAYIETYTLCMVFDTTC